MGLSRREFLKLLGSLMGGWAVTLPKSHPIRELVRISSKMSDLRVQGETLGLEDKEQQNDEADKLLLNPPTIRDSEKIIGLRKSGFTTNPEEERVLKGIGYFNEISPQSFVFDEKNIQHLDAN